jgi:hypothetical protein
MSFVAEMLMGIIVTTRFWFITIVSTIIKYKEITLVCVSEPIPKILRIIDYFVCVLLLRCSWV